MHIGPLVRRIDALVRRHDAHESAEGELDGYGDTVIWFDDGERRWSDGAVTTAPAPEDAHVIVSGDVEGIVDPEAGRIAVRVDGRPRAVIEAPGAGAFGLRAHGRTATVYTPDGRVVAVDLETRAATAVLTVRD